MSRGSILKYRSISSLTDQKEIKTKIIYLQVFTLGNKIVMSDFKMEIFISFLPYFYDFFYVWEALSKQVFRALQINCYSELGRI